MNNETIEVPVEWLTRLFELAETTEKNENIINYLIGYCLSSRILLKIKYTKLE